MESRAVPGGYAALYVTCGAGQDGIAFAEDFVERRIAVFAAGFGAGDGVGEGCYVGGRWRRLAARGRRTGCQEQKQKGRCVGRSPDLRAIHLCTRAAMTCARS